MTKICQKYYSRTGITLKAQYKPDLPEGSYLGNFLYWCYRDCHGNCQYTPRDQKPGLGTRYLAMNECSLPLNLILDTILDMIAARNLKTHRVPLPNMHRCGFGVTF